MHNKWKEYCIEDITKRVKVGYVGSCQKDYCTKDEGVPMIRTTNLTEGGIDYSDLKYVTRAFHEKNVKSQLHKNDILIARHGDNGKACIVKDDIEANCLNVIIIEPDKTRALPDFVKYLFEGDEIRHKIQGATVGSVQNVINTKTIAKLTAHIPDLDVQTRIVSILRTIDDAIDINNKINKNELIIHANLDKMIEALSKTEAYLNVKPRFESGDTDKSRILRSQNIYRNLFYIVAIFSHRIKFPIKGNLDVMIRKYRSEDIVLLSEGDDRADLKGACLAGAYLKNAKLIGADLTNADLRGADLRRVNLINASLNAAKLIEANLREAFLTNAKLIETTLDKAYLKNAILRGADLTLASMRGIDLTGADLTEAVLNNARMRGADLNGADLSGADLNHTFLRGADLRGAKLIGTKMDGTYLRGADLSGATITDVVDLNKAVFNGAKIDSRYKDLIDSSAEGYNSIIWVSYENTGNYGIVIKTNDVSTDTDNM